MQLKRIISLLLFTVPYQVIRHWKGKKLKFEKKKFRSQGTHNITHQKNKQCIFLECNFARKVVYFM